MNSVRRASPTIAAVWFALLSACSPRIPEGVFRCTTDQVCPPGQRCGSDGTCRRMPISEADAATPDAGPLDARLDAAMHDAAEAAVDASVAFSVLMLQPADVIERTDDALAVTFSATVDPSSVDEHSFVVTRDGVPVAGTRTIDGSHIRFAPSMPWTLSARYTLRLTTALRDHTGRASSETQHTLRVRDGVWTQSMAASPNVYHRSAHAAASHGGKLAILIEQIGASTGVPRKLHLVRRSAAGWTEPAHVCDSYDFISHPRALVVDDRGNVVVGCGYGSAAMVDVAAVFAADTNVRSGVPGPSAARYGSARLALAGDRAFALMTMQHEPRAPVLLRFDLTARTPAATTLPAGLGEDLAVLEDRVLVLWTETRDVDAGARTRVLAAAFSFEGECILHDGACAHVLSRPNADAFAPRLAADSVQGWAIAAWQTSGIESATYTPDGGWSSSMVAYESYAASEAPTVAVDARGTAHLAFLGREHVNPNAAVTMMRMEKGASAWREPEPVGLYGDTSRPSLAVEPGGNAVASWLEEVDPAHGGVGRVIAAQYVPELGEWKRAPGLPFDTGVSGTSVAIDASGRASVTWVKGGAVWVQRLE